MRFIYCPGARCGLRCRGNLQGQQEVSIAVLRERPRQPMQKEATTENEDISASTRQFECQW